MATTAQVEPALSAPQMPDAGEEVPAGVEEKLDKLFGSEEQPQAQPQEAQQGDDAEASTESETKEPEFVDIEVDGETWQVPPKLKDRFMAEKDYTAKTTELANTRKAIEAQQKEIVLYQEQRAFEQSIAADLDHLKMLDAYIQHEKSQKDWTKLTTDEIVRAQLQINQLADQRAALAEALQKKQNEFTAKLNGERSKLKEAAKEVLSKAIPNWSDDVRASVEKYAQSLGYPEVAVQNMSALDAQVAWKAMQYDKLKAETKQAVKRAADAPVIAPTARKNPMPKQVRAKLDLKNAVKSGDKTKIAAGVDARLTQIFGG